jgi:C4-dicarboxylate transporter, DctM subunit
VGRPFGLLVPGGADWLRQVMLWLAFVGGLAATTAGKHLTLSTADLFGKGRVRVAGHLLAAAISAAATAVLAYAALGLVLTNRQDPRTLTGGLPQWVSELVMPICLGAMALRFAWDAAAAPAAADGTPLPGTEATGASTWRRRAIAALAIPAAFALGFFPSLLAAGALPFVLIILVALAVGTPVFVAMGALSLLFFFRDGLPVTAVSAEVYRLIASPTLPAIPLLTACGYVLADSQASQRLLRFFRSVLGWMPGGLAVIVVAVCALFTTFTGGSGITIIAVGGLVLPMLLADGYSEEFSLGLVTAAGSLGLLFPPSLPVILYSVVAGTRDQKVPADSLYLAGILPGLLMMAMVAGYAVHKSRKMPLTRQVFSPREVLRAAWEAKWELGLPVFVVGIFASGRTSMVETAAAAVAYAVVVQCFVTRDLRLTSTLPAALLKSSVLTGSVLILLSAAMGITSYIVDAQIPDQLVALARQHIHSPLVYLLALNALLVVVGCLVDIFSAIVVLAPLIAPMGAIFGIDPVHQGVIFLANLELGYLTPPVGLNLYLSSSRFGQPLTRVVRTTLPFLVIMAVAVLLITYVPALSLGVLSVLGK